MPIGFLVFGILMDQMAAWQTLGIKLADGQVVRDSDAQRRLVASL